MANAEAMAQISAVMSAPSEPVGVVILRADGSADEATIDHRKVNELLGGTPTVVGAIRALNVQAVAQRGGNGKANKHKLSEDSFERKIKGDIVLLRTASDAVGSPRGLTLAEFQSWVEQGMPDGEDSDEEEGEEFGEDEEESEDGEEGSESGSEEEESGEDSESGEEEEIVWEALPVAKLRRACELEGIDADGSQAELMQRLISHAKEQTGDVSEEEGEKEEEEEQAPAKLNPKPKSGQKRAAGGAAVAGPSKAGGIAKGSKRGRK
jgi:hypothetical protein